ncbi:MAG: TIGR04283 family arsenosugar biosynthesis glycosyltransferase [Pseudomonadota bacterium]
MTAPMTVIIPTLNVADRIGPCLGALGEALFEGILAEVIFADGGSTDDIAKVADAVGARLVTSPKGRGTQLAAAARTARSDWLLFLHADSVLDAGWHHAVQDHIAQNPDRAGWFRLRFDSSDWQARVVERWATFRSFAFGLPYGDQGLLISQRLYNVVGGYRDFPLMEDVALARTLGRRRLTGLPCAIQTSAERYHRDGWERRGLRNLTTFALYLAGREPEALAKRYEAR